MQALCSDDIEEPHSITATMNKREYQTALQLFEIGQEMGFIECSIEEFFGFMLNSQICEMKQKQCLCLNIVKRTQR